jgi:hypothetical protein
MRTFIFFYLTIGLLFDNFLMIPTLKKISMFDVVPMLLLIAVGILTPFIYPLIIIWEIIGIIKRRKRIKEINGGK